MFRMWSPISVYVPDLAQYTVKKLGKKNMGVIYVQNDWGIQTKDYFVKELEKLGARVAALEVVYDKDTDFKAQLTKVKAANPDTLAILTYYTTGALLTLQARNLGITAPLVATGTLYEEKFIDWPARATRRASPSTPSSTPTIRRRSSRTSSPCTRSSTPVTSPSPTTRRPTTPRA